MDSDASDDDTTTINKPKKSFYALGKEGLVFLIDASQIMFDDDDPEEGNAFQKAFKCAKNAISNKAVSGVSDLIGIVLFGTKKTDNPQDLNNIVVVDVLKPPSADYIMEINDKWLKMSKDEFNDKYGHDNSYCLGDAFWVCNSMFTASRKKFFSKKILIFTATDDPHSDNKAYRNRSFSGAQDLKDWDIEIEVVPMKSPFELEKFYYDIVSDPLQYEENMNTKLADLMVRVRTKSHIQRVVTTLPVFLSPSIKFSVNMYVLLRETKKPTGIIIRKKDNEILRREATWVKDDDETIVESESIKKAVVIADECVVMERNDITTLKSSDVGFHLVGFKPKAFIKSYYHMGPGYFIFPTEKNIKGSTKIYNALLDKCLENDVIAITRTNLRSTSRTRLMALYPVDDEFLNGFYVFILPFAEDMRSIELPESDFTCVDEKIKEISKKIIEKCTKEYSPDIIQNPILQTFWSHIEALALNSSDAEDVIDMTDPSLYIDSKNIADLVKEFQGRLPAAKKSGNQPPADLKEAAQTGKLDKLTIPVLRAFINEKNIAPRGTRKADLVQAILRYYRVK